MNNMHSFFSSNSSHQSQNINCGGCQLSEIKGEPKWLLEWRLKAYEYWLSIKEPKWAKVNYDPIDYNSISYYSAPKKKNIKSLDEVDPEILLTYEKLGIPLNEQKMMEEMQKN